ncbi:MAG: outer membrane beta-barrel protein [Acidobacteriaceae bacterium]|nr:outer membrane beta-barrel protein [Acidobacteriaceae bacterium]
MKLSNLLCLAAAVALGTSAAQAQSGLDVLFGVSTATDSASPTSIDPFNTGTFSTTPKLGGTFGKIGADYMLTPHFGVGGEYDFRFSQGNYASGITYRPSFYDFNFIYMPTGHKFKRIVPEFQGGLGGMDLKFYYPSSSCDPLAGCNSSNTYLESSNHFQVHMEAGVRLYVTDHLFVRPQVDAHYVNNLFQFGSNWVPEFGGSVGWTFGER